MARGWESKSVEEQVADRQTDSENVPAVARQASAVQADLQRQRQALELQRERILDERTANPHRRAALNAALADIEERLQAIS
jgi:nitrogen fixation/metabolism regulation signal transduction histidine kinase